MTELKEDAAQWSPPPGQPVAPPGSGPGIPADRPQKPDARDADEFMQSLLDRLRDRLSGELDPEVQTAIGKLINQLVVMRPEVIWQHRALFNLAFDVFTAEKPNMILAQSIWRDMMIITDRSSFGLARIVSFIAGSTALSASIAALILAGFVSVGMLFMMVGTHQFALGSGFRASELLRQLQGGNAALLILAVHAAFIGGIVSILARIQDFVDTDSAGPVLVFISVFRKPFLGAAFGVLVFCVLRAGLVTFPGVSLQGTTGVYTAWTIGFLCGFSERFATDIIQSAGGRLGASTSPAPPGSAAPSAQAPQPK